MGYYSNNFKYLTLLQWHYRVDDYYGYYPTEFVQEAILYEWTYVSEFHS